MKLTGIALVAAMFAAGAAHAEGERTDPNSQMRGEVMKGIGGAMKVLGDMAKGDTAYDAAAAEAAKATLVEKADAVQTAFATMGEADPVSEAKPEIWTSWDDFVKKDEALKAAAAAADVSSAEAIGASLAALGGACKDCHTTYRVMKQ
ncbi:MAG: cytochrome c [Paracoccaceae bacterium]